MQAKGARGHRLEPLRWPSWPLPGALLWLPADIAGAHGGALFAFGGSMVATARHYSCAQYYSSVQYYSSAQYYSSVGYVASTRVAPTQGGSKIP